MAKKPASKDWHQADIIAAVRKTGTSMQQLSLSLGMAKGTLGQAMYRPYPRCERLIAEHLGTTPQTIWPSRHHLDGTAKSGRGERGIGRHPSNLKRNGSTTKKPRNVYPLDHKAAA